MGASMNKPCPSVSQTATSFIKWWRAVAQTRTSVAMKRRITASFPLQPRPLSGYGKYLRQCHRVSSNHVTVVISLHSRHQFYELYAHMWPLIDRGLCFSVCLGGWKRCCWFPRSLADLFCTNIWKYFTSICSALSPWAVCLHFCISVAVRVIEREKIRKVPVHCE